ncbi:MAG: TIGR00282 family metallophosphoesterase [Armatimonadetes bacterium]|nr:TIGR00282 family metallophosphoesterase [Armatimonadota bacterium]
MSQTYRILFLGDVVGRPGREAVLKHLQRLKSKYKANVVIVNGENAASGQGITPAIATDIFDVGADAITLGNHWYRKREIGEYLNSKKPIVRPANLPDACPGRGMTIIQHGSIKIAVINALGRVYMDAADDPFPVLDQLVNEAGTPHIFVDFHAEATSEKKAVGYFLDGRVTAVVGTHTHVQTADEIVLPGGTAYITDVGMCGPEPSVLGVQKELVIKRFLTSLPAKFEVASEPSVICGVVIDVQKETGRANSIERICVSGE